jgi:hypothetical protein
VARLTFGIALDFGSKLRPLEAQLERQSKLLEPAEAAGFAMVATGEIASPGGFHLPNALLVLATLTQQTHLRLCTAICSPAAAAQPRTRSSGVARRCSRRSMKKQLLLGISAGLYDSRLCRSAM